MLTWEDRLFRVTLTLMVLGYIPWRMFTCLVDSLHDWRAGRTPRVLTVWRRRS